MGPPLLNTVPDSPQLWAAPPPGQSSLVGGGRTMWRLLPSTTPPPVRPGSCCVGVQLFTPALSVGVCRPHHPHSCHLPITTRFPAFLSSPFTVPPTSPYIPVVLHKPPSLCPPASHTSLPLSLPLPPYHFHLGRPPSAQGHDLSRGRLVDPLPTRSPPGLPSGMPIHSRLTPLPSALLLLPISRHPHSLRRGRCGRSGGKGGLR